MFLWNSLVAVWSSVLFENILGLFSIKGKAGREHSKWKDVSSRVLSEIYFSVNKVPLGINCSSLEMYHYGSYHICQFRQRDNLLSILFPWKLILPSTASTTLSLYLLDQIETLGFLFRATHHSSSSLRGSPALLTCCAVTSASATCWRSCLCTWQPQTHWKCQPPRPLTDSLLEDEPDWLNQNVYSFLEHHTSSFLPALIASRFLSIFCSWNRLLYSKWINNEIYSNYQFLPVPVLPTSKY